MLLDYKAGEAMNVITTSVKTDIDAVRLVLSSTINIPDFAIASHSVAG